MRILKNFFLHVRQSIYGPSFYEDLLQIPLARSFRYFIGLTVLLALIVTMIGVRYIPSIKAFMAELRPSIIQSFPEELVVKITEGKVSTNVAEPYFVAMPEPLLSFFPKSNSGDLPSLIVIDTKNSFSLEQFRKYHALSWLTKDAIAIQEENGGFRVIPLDTRANEHIDKKTIVLVTDKIAPYFNFAPPLFLLAIFGGTIFVTGLNLVYLLLGALFIYFLARVRKINISYKKAYQWGLHAMTLPLVVQLVLIAAGLEAPFLFTAILLFVVWFNLPPRGTGIPAVVPPIPSSPSTEA